MAPSSVGPSITLNIALAHLVKRGTRFERIKLSAVTSAIISIFDSDLHGEAKERHPLAVVLAIVEEAVRRIAHGDKVVAAWAAWAE